MPVTILTKNTRDARYSQSAQSRARLKPSRLDHLTWSAINKNTVIRNNLESDNPTIGTDTKIVKIGGDHAVKVDKESGSGGSSGGRELVRTSGSFAGGSITQPAYTTLKKLEIIFNTNIECAASGHLHLIVRSGSTTILHDSSSAAAILGNSGKVGQYQPIVLVDNFQPIPANTGELNNAKFTLSSPFTNVDRDLSFSIEVNSANLVAPSAGTNPFVSVVGHFAYVSDNH